MEFLFIYYHYRILKDSLGLSLFFTPAELESDCEINTLVNHIASTHPQERFVQHSRFYGGEH